MKRPPRHIRALTRVLLLSLAGGVVVAGQNGPADPADPALRLRVEANYVEVDASVVDARGQAIDDLTVGDFEVLEDGARQEIEIFSHVQLALPRPSPRSSPAAVKLDVVTSRQGSGRIYIVVLDDLHIAQANVPRVKTSVRQFLDSALGPTDLAAVVFTSGRTGRVRPFAKQVGTRSNSSGRRARHAPTLHMVAG